MALCLCTSRGANGVLAPTDRESYPLWLHDDLALLPVVILIDYAAFTALAMAINAGSTACTRVSVDEKVNEHSGLGRTQTRATLVKLLFAKTFSESTGTRRPYQTKVGEGRADVHDQ